MKKIKVNRPFGVMVGVRETRFPIGVYTVPMQMSESAAQFGVSMRYAQWLMTEKRAPENKLHDVAEHKEGLARPVRGRRKRSKPENDSEE
jgi:hypothetical protein